MHVIILVFILISSFSSYSRQEIRIGGLFDKNDADDLLGFELAANTINKYSENHYRIKPLAAEVPHLNPLMVSHTLCSMFQKGIAGVIGPTSPITSLHVKSLCDAKDIPLVEIHAAAETSDSFVNLYPYSQQLARSYVELVRAWGWGSFTILYENDESLLRISELLKMYDRMEHTVTLRQLERDGNHRHTLMNVKKLGEKRFLIDCSIDILGEVLQQAQQVGIMTEQYNFIIVNLDISLMDLSAYQYGGSNITGIRLINPEHSRVRLTTEGLQSLRLKHNMKYTSSVMPLKTQTALLIDAVYLLYETLKELRISGTSDISPIYCNSSASWERGLSIINYMKANTMEGITGTIKFDSETGVRNEFTLEVVELSVRGLVKVGAWNSKEGLNITRVHVDSEDADYDEENPLRNKMFQIITALTPPYGMLKNVSSTLAGNDQYEGYGIDLIQKLSHMLGFNYTFVIQWDGANGEYNKRTNKWSGMLGEVVEGRVDFAIADLTITSEREKYVDFTMPFMNLGISILYKKPSPVPPSLLTFAFPFSGEVWLLLAVSYFLVSVSLFIMGRLSPSEWTNPYPCVEEPEFLVTQFSFRNSLWFTLGSLMQQGTEIAPLSVSTRMAAGVWWFFTLILVSSYTANLVAFLAFEEYVTPFTDVEELVKQNEVKYGAKAKGATYAFFRDSNYSVYPQIQEFMDINPDCMTFSNDDGVRKVEEENYAFFMESTSIEFTIERHCDLAQVGGALDEKGYGIAMKKDSRYRHVLSTAILELQETGELEKLKTKWWKERGSENCQKPEPEAAPLNLQNVGGVFVVMGAGTFLGIIGTLIEMALHTYRTSNKNKEQNFKEEVKNELRFFIKFKHMTKDARKKQKGDSIENS